MTALTSLLKPLRMKIAVALPLLTVVLALSAAAGTATFSYLTSPRRDAGAQC